MVNNIFCIGRNYVAHAHELGNDVPEEPLIFTKPTHALTAATGQTIYFPGNKGALHYEAELVVKMGRDYEAGLPVDALISDMTIGLDLTYRDIQAQLKAKGHPWTIAKGFPNAAIIGNWLPFPGEKTCLNHTYSLDINKERVQIGDMNLMIFPLIEQITYIGTHIGLGKNDIIFTGTPEGVGPLNSGDTLELNWDKQTVGSCTIHIDS